MIAMCLYCLYLFDPCNDMLISINEPLKVFKSREKNESIPIQPLLWSTVSRDLLRQYLMHIRSLTLTNIQVLFMH